MKFYYQDKLIRTSKNHNYTHAVIDTRTGKCLGCRTSMEACESIITTEINRFLRGIHSNEERIKALEAGKSGYYIKDGKRTYWHKFGSSPYDTIEKSHENIDSYRKMIESIRQNWQIVELECR